MSILSDFLISRRAAQDARLEIEQGEETLTSHLGNKPVFNPVVNAEHTQLNRDLNNSVEIEELTADLHQRQDELAKHHPKWGMDLLALLLLSAEFLGCLYVTRQMGLHSPMNSILAVCLAAFMFFFCGWLSVGERPRRWFWLGMAAYAAVVISMAVMRVDVAGGDGDTTRSVDWAAAIIGLASTVGPAFMFESLWRLRRPVAILSREISNLRARIWKLQHDQRAAERKVKSIARDGAKWQRTHDELLARYNTEHRRESSKKP